MPEVWAAIVGAIVLLIAYGVISSRMRTARLRKAREKTLPFVAEAVRTGQRYNLYLSDGRKFLEAELVGTSDPESGQSPFGGHEGMLVLKQPSGKKAFVRPSSVRVVEEA
jgi:hypothetical protein